MNLASLLAAATEGESHAESETLFIVMGIVLAAFAVVVSTIGIRTPNLSDGATRAITAVGVVLVVVTMAAMVVIST